MELRSSQDSYQRKEKKKIRQNTCSSDLLQKYTIKEIDEEFRNPLRKIKTNNYLYHATNDENDNRKSNSKSSATRGSKTSDAERKIQTLKNENRKLVYMLESSEKLMHKKLKESKHQTEKIMNIVNKVWKIMQKQVMDPQQRRLYFDKNSPDEIELKKLLKENELLRSKRETRPKLLQNLADILELCCTKLAVKQEYDAQMCKNYYKLESEFKYTKEKELQFSQIIKENELTIKRQQKMIEELNLKFDELDAFKITTLDRTVHQLAEQEDLLIQIQDLERSKSKTQYKIQESQDLPTFG